MNPVDLGLAGALLLVGSTASAFWFGYDNSPRARRILAWLWAPMLLGTGLVLGGMAVAGGG